MVSEQSDEEIRKIACLLGGLPLAISQIAGFLVESECPLDEFASLYSTYENMDKIHATSSAGSTTFYQHTLSTVFTMSINSLDPDATKMLHLAAFLDPDSLFFSTIDPSSLLIVIGIPNSLFNTLPEAQLPQSLGFLSNKLKLRLAISKLRRHCLVKTNAVDTTLSIHRLVQFSALQLMGEDRRKEAFENSLHLLSQLFPAHPPYRLQMASVWSQSEVLVPHVLSLHSRYREFSKELGVPIELGKLLDSCSW